MNFKDSASGRGLSSLGLSSEHVHVTNIRERQAIFISQTHKFVPKGFTYREFTGLHVASYPLNVYEGQHVSVRKWICG